MALSHQTISVLEIVLLFFSARIIGTQMTGPPNVAGNACNMGWTRPKSEAVI
ncbi:TPA: hypothetical protein ACNIJL_003922 [Pseudomonas aeruginosa]